MFCILYDVRVALLFTVFCFRLAQILRNVASNPEDPRFRRIKRDNENFQRALGRFEGGIQILLSSGFRMQVQQ